MSETVESSLEAVSKYLRLVFERLSLGELACACADGPVCLHAQVHNTCKTTCLQWQA